MPCRLALPPALPTPAFPAIIERMFEPTPRSPAAGRLHAAHEARAAAEIEEAKAILEVAAELDEASWRQVLDSLRDLTSRLAPDRMAEVAGEMATERFVHKLATDDPATAHLSARVATADSIFFDAMVERIADILGDRGDIDPWDALRAKSVGILAHPAVAQRLLAEAAGASEAPPPDDPEAP